MVVLVSRRLVLKEVWSRAWVRWSVYIWGPIGAYDTFASELLPRSLQEKAPTVYEIISITSGWLPWWTWLLLGAAIFAGAYLEYACRHTLQSTILREEGPIVPSTRHPVVEEVAVRRDSWIEDAITQKGRNAIGVEINPNALKLEVKEDAPYFKTKSANLYRTERTYPLKLENTDKFKAIAGAKITLLGVEPEEYPGPWTLKTDISLAAGDHIFVPLVTYGESADNKKFPCGDSFMVFQVPGKSPPTASADKRHVLTLRATAMETGPCNLKCRVWVDEEGHFRLEQVTSSSEKFIPLPKATEIVWRAIQGTEFAEKLEQEERTPKKILHALSSRLLRKGLVWGVKWPSTEMAQIEQGTLFYVMDDV